MMEFWEIFSTLEAWNSQFAGKHNQGVLVAPLLGALVAIVLGVAYAILLFLRITARRKQR